MCITTYQNVFRHMWIFLTDRNCLFEKVSFNPCKYLGCDREFANNEQKHKRNFFFKTSHVALILNRNFAFALMFPFTFVIHKLPIVLFSHYFHKDVVTNNKLNCVYISTLFVSYIFFQKSSNPPSESGKTASGKSYTSNWNINVKNWPFIYFTCV